LKAFHNNIYCIYQQKKRKNTAMNRITSAALLLALASTSEAFGVERRQVFGLIGSGIAGAAVAAANPDAASATVAKTGSSSPFTGDFDDPNHPGCLRQVKVVGAPLRGDGTRSPIPLVEVTGWDGRGDGNVCTDRPTREELWKVQGKMKNSNEAILDFSPKGGPSNLVGTWDGSGIVFPDGNKWTKVIEGTNNRRPKDMSTLKSLG
jgi:hypothetical protein